MKKRVIQSSKKSQKAAAMCRKEKRKASHVKWVMYDASTVVYYSNETRSSESTCYVVRYGGAR